MLKDKLCDFYHHYKKIILIGASSIIVGLIYGSYLFMFKDKTKDEKEEVLELTKEVVSKPKEEVNQVEYYFVDIKGAINKPDVYKVEKGSRVIDIIKLAGGFTKDADASVLNLSKKINDEMYIMVYTKNQIKQYKKINTVSNDQVIDNMEKECSCPDPKTNNACLDCNESNQAEHKISINTGTLTELQQLSGIGESKAQNIIDYRNTNGLFKVLEDLKKVSGIGESIFAKVKDNITL